MKRIVVVLSLLTGSLLWGNPTPQEKTALLKQKGAQTLEQILREKEPELQVKEPTDLIDFIPIVGEIKAMIPRRFFVGYHDFEIAGHKMIIHHRNLDQQTLRAPKRTIIALEYTGDIGSSFGTEVEMDLFYAPSLGLRNWSRYPVGNYRMILDQTQIYRRDALYLKAQTRF